MPVSEILLFQKFDVAFSPRNFTFFKKDAGSGPET